MPTVATEKYRKSPKGRETARLYQREYYHRVLKHDPEEKAQRQARNRRNYYRRTFDLSPEEADRMKTRGCDLCGVRHGKLNIDHDHRTGKVRGVLCNPCNLMLGYLEKAESQRNSVARYLKREVCFRAV